MSEKLTDAELAEAQLGLTVRFNARLVSEVRELRADRERLLNVVRGCHDYNGGHRIDDGTSQIFHHGIQTVVNAVESAAKERTLQTDMLEQIGRDAARKGEPNA